MKILNLIVVPAVLAGCAGTVQQGAEAPMPLAAPTLAVANEPVPTVSREAPTQMATVAPAAPVVVVTPVVVAPVVAQTAPSSAKVEAAEPKTATGWEDLSRIIAAWMAPAQKAAADNCPQDTRKP